MKSAVILASAGVVLGQAITSDIAAISSAAAVLNSQVSAFSVYSQASAIVDSSQNIVSLIEKGTQDAISGGAISQDQVTNLLAPFQALQAIVSSAVGNLVGRKAVATSLTLGNVVEAQLVSQLSAAQAFAAAVQSQLPPLFSSIGGALASSILSDLSSGSAAFSGLSGPSTVGSGPGSASASATATASGSSSASSSASSGSSASASSGLVTSASSTASATGGSTGSSVSSAPTSTGTIVPSNSGNKATAGFFGVAAAAFIGMVAL